MTRAERIALLDTLHPFDLDGAIAIAKKIIEATGDLPQGDWFHMATLQADPAAAMKVLAELRPEGAPPYDPAKYI